MIRTNGKSLLWILLTLTLSLAGCQPVIGWLVNVFAPPKKVAPVYAPPPDKKVLVFVDDLTNPVSYAPIKGLLTKRLNDRLIEHRVAADVVPHGELLTLMAATPEFNQLGIVQVGSQLGADLVLYIHIDEFSLKDNEATPLWTGKLRTKVRLIDVQKGLLKQQPRLFPEDRPEGYPVKDVETPAETHPSPRYGEDLAKTLADKMADRIAKLFYEHEITAQEAREEQEQDT
ncbi:MAG: hypothetical protein ACYSTL_05125 [Planctomycetota bacterium]|jgi:hypothetical protein